MKKLFFTLGCFLVLVSALAQSGKYGKNSIGISLGWQKLKFLDELASPLSYKATASPFAGINYTHNGSHSYVKLGISGGLGSADPDRFGARDYLVHWSDKDSFQYRISSMFASAHLEATYLRKLNPASTGAWAYWLGGTFNDQAYYADEVANMPWVANAAEFSPSFKMDYQPGSRHLLSLKIDLAGVALFSRSVYGLFAKSNKESNVTSLLKQGTRLTSVHEYQKVNVELTYNCHLSSRMALGGTYALKWLHYSYPQSLRAADSRFHLNVNYTLHP